MKSSILRKVCIAIVALLILIQFFHPSKNIATTPSANAIETHYSMPANVSTLIKTSCYDCHSNNTSYPWYNNIQPVAWWLNSHVNDGKRHLNFDEFNSYTTAQKTKKLDEIVETLQKGEMPLSSYTLIHKNAILTRAQQKAIIDWANTTKQTIK